MQQKYFDVVAVFCCEHSDELLHGDAMYEVLRETMGLADETGMTSPETK